MSERFIKLIVMCFAFVAGSAMAQYPNRPIKMIVPFSAGSSTDLFARALANVMSPSLGQSIIIENKPGADGAIGATEVARAAPDGYTLMMTTMSSMSVVPAMRKVPPYDVLKDFSPISLVGHYSLFLVVNAEMPVNSLQELLDYTRANPGKLNYAYGSTGGLIATEQMLTLGGNLNMVRVPYKGEPPAINDLLTNRVQVMFATMTVAGSHVKQGKLRILATSLKRRSPSAPDVPTMAEAGMPKHSYIGGWGGFFGPANMPKDIVDRLSREMNAALNRPEIQEMFNRQYFSIQGSAPAELYAFTKEQLDVYSRALRAVGIYPE